MAPVGNNGPYIPRLDLEPNRKSSLAIKNVTRSPLGDITNQPTRTGRNANAGGASGVGGASNVGGRTEPGEVRLNPNARRGDPNRDSITIESKWVRQRIDARRADKSLPLDVNFSGDYGNHPTTELVVGGKLWSHTRSGATAAQFKVTSSGLYELTGALPETVAPVAQAAKRPAAAKAAARPMALRTALKPL